MSAPSHLAVDPRVGLEVHVRLATRSKLLCACPNDPDLAPNVATCPVCVGLPGSMPVLGGEAVRLGLLAALRLGCQVPARSAFDRKHYVYPDLPKGYQVTQDARPLALGGSLELSSGKRIPLERIHLEEDAGRSRHDGAATLVDLNRAGVPLIEVVTEPVLRSGAEVRDFLLRLREELRFCGVSDCDMDRGSLRCDVNVSLAPRGSATFARVELKNLNSIRAAGAAVTAEFERLHKQLARSAPPASSAPRNETRRWNADSGRSEPMRAKEAALDYRFLPEPDLLELEVTPEDLAAIGAGLELGPLARRRSWRTQHGLSQTDAADLCGSRALADHFDATVAAGAPARSAAKWLLNEPDPALAHGADPTAAPRLSATRLAELLAALDAGTISAATARELAEHLATRPAAEPERRPLPELVEALGLAELTDRDTLDAAVDAALVARPDAAVAYRAGRSAALEVLVGEVLRATAGRADAAVARRLLGVALGR
ncbi:MAG: Asp-tRNA(Asn)/Glu-tRNA(Gln) amidotransferase subunit GatB [Planctomycetota bacterium]|nr:Asp-tRNA(Asn)/Glu-tRNA(Gln) amidotransferase subunit GatB [Planctomycetota bacterium]